MRVMWWVLFSAVLIASPCGGAEVTTLRVASLMLKPVVAVSYNRKVNILMDDLTCHDYSLDIIDTSFESLTKTFESLVANIDGVREILKDKVTLYVRQLDEQYQDVLGLLESENRRLPS